MPLITRRSSILAFPRVSIGRCGEIFANWASVSQKGWESSELPLGSCESGHRAYANNFMGLGPKTCPCFIAYVIAVLLAPSDREGVALCSDQASVWVSVQTQ
jgi:hypothetical protein